MKIAKLLLPAAAIACSALLPPAASASKPHPHHHRHGHHHHAGSRRHNPRVEAFNRTKPAHNHTHGTPSATGSAAPSAAAMIASVLATPCQNTELMPEAGNLELIDAATLCLINKERATHGEQPLEPNHDLEVAADGHSQELISADYFAHVSPTGETPVDRIRATGYIPSPLDGYVIGENLAWGTYTLSTPQAIVAAWIASPGHLANILESHYTDTGIGVVPAVPSSLAAGAPGATYAQEFGTIIP